ncbi:MAG: glycosyltransferase family 39 protein [Planctomycetes bacterium]|nr:glycosyltransferase family 39 protein [Planctomycetota bacterium]
MLLRERVVQCAALLRQQVLPPAGRGGGYRGSAASILCVVALSRLATQYLLFDSLVPASTGSDAREWCHLADQVAAGHWPDMERAPLWPAVLGAWRATVGTGLAHVRLLQALLDGCTALVIHSLVRPRMGPAAALAACAIWGLHPLCAWVASDALREPLLSLTIVLSVWALVRAAEVPGRATGAAAGVLLGLAALGKAALLGLPLVVAPWLWRRDRAGTIAMLAAFLLTLSPWTVHNALETGLPLPVSTDRGGVSFFVGNYLPSEGRWEGPDAAGWRSYLASLPRPETPRQVVLQDLRLYRDGLVTMGMSPLATAATWARKALRFWFASASGTHDTAIAVLQGTLLLVALVGATRLARHPAATTLRGPLLLTPAYFYAVHVASYANVRFSLALVPLLAVMACVLVTPPADEGSPSPPSY